MKGFFKIQFSLNCGLFLVICKWLLIIYFSIFVFICQICFWEFNINNLIASLTLHNAIVPQLPLVNGSYWFVPMYCVSILVAYGIISTFKSKGVIFIILFICYYFFGYIQKISIEQSFLGVPVQSLLFYTSCVLFGYYLSRFRGNKLWLMVAVLSLCLFLFLIHGNPNAFNLQNYKFPIGLPYVVASFISLCIIMYGNFLKSRSCFTYIGKYSIFFYMGQCVGGSLIYQIVPFITLVWWVKIILLFSFNMLISIFIGYLLVKLFTLKFL